jgi:hypothetical protein
VAWKKGQSGNPAGRGLEIAQRLVDAGLNPSENVYVPILEKRDPAKELIKLADKSKDSTFKRGIWEFLFVQKYKGVKIVSKPLKSVQDQTLSDEDTLKLLEGNRPLESNPSASSVKPTPALNDSKSPASQEEI